MARYEVCPLILYYPPILLTIYSETGPKQGTLQVFPDVILSNAYTILRPFFRFTGSGNELDPKNWEFGMLLL